MVLLFTPYRVYGAAFLAVVGTIQACNKGRCPMTDREKELREEAGEKVELKFVQGIFKKVFGIVVPNWVFATITWAAFIASYIIIFIFLWNLLK